MKILLLALYPLLAFGQSATSVVTPHQAAPATVNYYVSTAGSDSNPCTSASKCLTVAHVLTLIPRTLDSTYIINVADGTYALQPPDFSGFLGADANYAGQGVPYIELLGNMTTPANVVFTSTTQLQCTGGDVAASFYSGSCIAGTANIKLSGLTLSTTQRNGIACYGGGLELAKVVVSMTGGAASANVGLNNLGCKVFQSGDVTFTGIDTNTAPTGGLGVYVARHALYEHFGGTLTITGPGTGSSASADGTNGLVSENGGNFSMTASTASIVISGFQTCINLAASGVFSQLGGSGTLACTNGSTSPTGSNGVFSNNGATFSWVGGTITVDHYDNCLNAASNSVQSGGGVITETFTNCTARVTSDGGVIVGL